MTEKEYQSQIGLPTKQQPESGSVEWPEFDMKPPPAMPSPKKEGKPRTDLIPTESIMALAHALTVGAGKHGPRGWERGYAWSVYYAALLRHLFAWWSGETTDDDTGMSHLWLVMANAAILTTYEARGVGEDDREGGKS